MGSWRLEAGKMVGYLTFPIVAFIMFNHPKFYEYSLRQTMENVSKDINLEDLGRYQKLISKKEVDNLDYTIEELDVKKK